MMLPLLIPLFISIAGEAPASSIHAGSQPVAGTPDGKARPFLDRLQSVDEAMARVEDLRAEFEQHRHTPLLKRPLVSKGVVLCKGDLVRWDTTSPRRSSLLIGEGSIRMYYPEDKLVEIYPLGEGFQDLAGAPLPRLSILKKRFDIVQIALKDLNAREDEPKLLAIEMTPKGQDFRRHVASVKVLIDESRPAAIKVVITDPDGEVTEIVFSHIAINGGLKREQIDLKLPENVRVSRPLGEGEKRGVEAPARETDQR